MSAEIEYRALPALSGTGVADLLKSPADYKWRLDNPRPSTPAQALGTLVHALVLGTEPTAVVSPFDSSRTKEAREWKALQAVDGIDVVSAEDWEAAEVMRDAVAAHLEASALLNLPGKSEVIVSGEHKGAPLKGRIDRLPDTGPIMDLKTSRDHSRDAMERAMGEYGSATQLAHYALLTGREEHRPYIIAVRNTDRPAVAVYRIAEMTWHIALDATRRAWDIYAECVRTDTWPDPYAVGVGELEMKPWHLDVLDPVDEIEVA